LSSKDKDKSEEKLGKGDSNMKIKTKVLLLVSLFILALPMVLSVGIVQANDSHRTVQGEVGIIDWCARTVFIDDVIFNMGTLNLVGTIDTGDRVQVNYENTNQGKVIKSVQVLSRRGNQ